MTRTSVGAALRRGSAREIGEFITSREARNVAEAVSREQQALQVCSTERYSVCDARGPGLALSKYLMLPLETWR